MTESAAGPTGPGTVVLDLGANVGALILYTPAELDGVEIEISRDDEPGAHRTHSQVRQRPMATATTYAAVYPSLTEGQYTIWRDEHTPEATITIRGGEITKHHFSAPLGTPHH
ncbi:MAG: phospholipase [Actinomycetota bacterium]|nr:phospholipase [Actinomycetota bacterium]